MVYDSSDRYLNYRFLRERRMGVFLFSIEIEEIVTPEKRLLESILVSDLLFPFLIAVALLFLASLFLLQQFNHVIDRHCIITGLFDHCIHRNL